MLISFSKTVSLCNSLSFSLSSILTIFNTKHQTFHTLSPSPQQTVMPSGPKKRNAAKKKKRHNPPILHSSPTIQGNVSQNRYKLDSVDTDSSAFRAVVPFNFAHMEEESANHTLEDIQKEEVQLDEVILKEVAVLELVKEIDIGDGSSRSSEEEAAKVEENTSEFVEEEKLEEEKQKEVSDSFVASLNEAGDPVQAVETPVDKSLVPELPEVGSEKIEETLSQSLDDCNGVSSIASEIVSNGTKETESVAAVAEEEKKEESAGVVDLGSEGNANSLFEEAVVVPAEKPRAIEPQIPESTEYQVAAVDTSIVSEHQNEPEIPESTGYQSPIIPVTQRTLHPTSWRSCCGLFEVLRRSDR